MIRSAEQHDAEAIARIYNHYVACSIATFEEQAVSTDQMLNRLCAILQRPLPWLVLEADGIVRGYAYAAPWKTRSAYRHTVEVSVYIDAEKTSSGFGTQLYESLFLALKKHSVHSMIGGVALPNNACVALHEKMGFKQVAHFRQTGFKFDRWIDVGYWQRML